MKNTAILLAATAAIGVTFALSTPAHADNVCELGGTSQTGGAVAELNSLACGPFANASGSGATAVGPGASASGDHSTAIGRATADQANSLVIDTSTSSQDTDVGGANAIAIGDTVKALSTDSIAMGHNSTASGTSSIAIGTGIEATGQGTVAIGAGSSATADNSVALGQNSVADQANTVSVGASGAERRITNVAEGVNDTDAVNVGQMNAAFAALGDNSAALADLDSRIDVLEAFAGSVSHDLKRVDRRATAGTATAIALSGAMFLPGKKFNLTGNVGSYRGAWAGAMQIGAMVGKSVAINAGVSRGFNKGGKTGFRAGFTIGF